MRPALTGPAPLAFWAPDVDIYEEGNNFIVRFAYYCLDELVMVSLSELGKLWQLADACADLLGEFVTGPAPKAFYLSLGAVLL